MARKMKDSGIEWIGEIPEGWEITRLKYLADFEPTCDTSYLTDESEITYTPMECVKNGDFENRSALYGNLSHTLTPFQNGDIAMAKVTPCFENGNIAIMNNLFSGFGLGSSELFIFRPKSISTRYLFYWLQNKAFVARACSTMTGTGGLKRISPSFIRNCPVHCPSMDEQTKISDYLKEKCSEIDTMLSKTRSSIEEYKKLKQAVITQAVTKGVRGEREMKDSGVEWIGKIPKEWGISRIKYVSIFEPSCDFRKLTSETIITYSPMECIKNGTFERRTSLYGNLAHTLTPFQDGDIVMAKVTPCFENGNIAIMNELQSGYGLGSSELFVFRPQNINTRYLFYWLQNKLFVCQACATMTGTGGLKRISPSFVKNCNIHYPTAAEQAEIADYLDAKCAEIDKLIAKKEQLVKELESYKKSLIYEVVTGKREV